MTPPGDAPNEAPPSPAPRDDVLVELNALLGRGTHYEGKLYFEGRIRIEGHFEGEIRGDILVIGAGAHISGHIEVGVCIVTGGTVHADLRAREAIELHAPAEVTGDLHAPNVFIDRGVKFEGNCRMAPLESSDPAPPMDAEPEAPSPEEQAFAVAAAETGESKIIGPEDIRQASDDAPDEG